MNNHIMANLRIIVNGNVWVNDGVFTNVYIGTNGNIRSNLSVFTNLSRRMNQISGEIERFEMIG